jgi:hypothetical protein
MLQFNKIALKIFSAPLLFCILLVCAPRGAVAQAQPQKPLAANNILILHALEPMTPIFEKTEE